MPEIALHIMDLVQNCISAMAKHIRILLMESFVANTLEILIADDGKGMSEEFLERVTSPFTTTRTTRRVGLGIPLMKAGCEMAGGSFSITSKLGEGTAISGTYQLDHIDRPPLGDFVGTVHTLITCNPDIDFRIEIKSDTQEICLDTQEVRAQVGDSPLNQPDVSMWIKEYLEEAMKQANIQA